MDIPTKVHELGLTPDTAVVIGSGILNVLDIRPSNDIDLVVNDETYAHLRQTALFTAKPHHGQEILTNDVFEIMTTWEVLGKKQTFADLAAHSVIIDDVRYLTVDFLLTIKQSWVTDGTVRQKDLADIELIKRYLGDTS